MKMVRIRTTTRKSEFLSPFVYPADIAQEKINKISAWHKPPTYSMVTVDNFPQGVIFDPDWELDAIVIKVPMAEKMWMRAT